MDKLQKIGCAIDPYLDSYTNDISLLPSVKYAHIYNFIGSHMINGSDPQRAFKSLDGYLMVVSSGWMGSLYVKKWTHAVLVKCDVKPSQRSGTVYKTWVAVKPRCAFLLCGLKKMCILRKFKLIHHFLKQMSSLQTI